MKTKPPWAGEVVEVTEEEAVALAAMGIAVYWDDSVRHVFDWHKYPFTSDAYRVCTDTEWSMFDEIYDDFFVFFYMHREGAE